MSRSKAIPRILIAGASSGSGKTSISMGLLRAFKNRGRDVRPFKSGPDYIDPGHLSLASGRECRNLDLILMGLEGVRASFSRNSSEGGLSLIEGVMGLYDGKGGISSLGSSADLAKRLKIPVLVIIDAGATAQTAGAVALGMKAYDPDLPLAGFLANKVGSDRHFAMVKRAIEDATGLPVFGEVRKQRDLAMPERHLGLVAAWEEEPRRRLEAVAEALSLEVEARVDLQALYAAAASAPPLELPESPELPSFELSGSCRPGGSDSEGTVPAGTPPEGAKPLRLGLAMDRAFHFYYRDNLDILEALGAQLVAFSPLDDPGLPMDLDGIYFGGGYPELYARALSENSGMIEEIRVASREGMPIFGECGGLMYLSQHLITEGGRFPMAGLFPCEIEMGRKLSALGYHEGRTLCDSILGPRGTKMTGHIYRWSRLTSLNGEGSRSPLLALEKEGEESCDGFLVRRSVASYLHIHFAGTMHVARSFLSSMADYRRECLKDGGNVTRMNKKE